MTSHLAGKTGASNAKMSAELRVVARTVSKGSAMTSGPRGLCSFEFSRPERENFLACRGKITFWHGVGEREYDFKAREECVVSIYPFQRARSAGRCTVVCSSLWIFVLAFPP